MSTSWVPNQYPPTKRSEHVDVYQSARRGELTVPNPYQWLETKSDETDKWTSIQQAFTREYLDGNPELEHLRTAFQDCIDYPKFSTPELCCDGRWYWLYVCGRDPQMTLYRSQDRTLPDFSKMKNSDFEIFFDPNALSSDGKMTTLKSYKVSKCGKYLGYSVSQSGSNFVTVYVRHTSSPFIKGIDHDNDPGRLPEEIKCSRLSVFQWSPDSSGFFYEHFPEGMICYHRLGTEQSADIILYRAQPKKTRNWNAIQVSEDGMYLILTATKDGQRNLLWVSKLDMENIGPNIKWIKLVNEFNAEYKFITNIGSILYILTNHSAPKYKIVTFDLDKPAFRDLIPMTDATLFSAILVAGDKLVLTYKRNVIDEIYIYSLSGEMICRVAEESVGSATAIGQQEQPWLFIAMTGFTTPMTIGLYDFSAPEHMRWSIYRTTVLNGLDPDEFESKQVWYNSQDGTKIPMFIVRHKSTKFDGTAPVLQLGYGALNISVAPFFNDAMLTFLRNYGAVYAIPNIRGGGEFGKEWHLAGCREKKFNCFDDFIAATEYLVSNKYADPAKVAIMGCFNGGLLVAACVNRAPEGTFGCAVAEGGLYDMLKIGNPRVTTGPSKIARMLNLLKEEFFHGLPHSSAEFLKQFTATWGRRQNQRFGRAIACRRPFRRVERNGSPWTSDYGNPEDPNDFDFIYPISPLQNLPKGKVLPPCLLMIADHDDRAVPTQSLKMTATLQYTAAHNPHPLLLHVDNRLGISIQNQIYHNTDRFGFIVQSLGLERRETTF